MNEQDELIKVTINIPKSYRRKIKAIAALKGIGFSSYIVKCIEKVIFLKKEETCENESTDPVIKEIESLMQAES